MSDSRANAARAAGVAEVAAAMTAMRDEFRDGVSRLVRAIEHTGDEGDSLKSLQACDCVEINGEEFRPPSWIKGAYGLEAGTLRQAANDPSRKLRTAKFRNSNLYSVQHIEELQKQGRLKIEVSYLTQASVKPSI